VAERCAIPVTWTSIAVDLVLLSHYDHLLQAVELSILSTATQHHANTLSLLQDIPGVPCAAPCIFNSGCC
jgi:hypothetical protein